MWEGARTSSSLARRRSSSLISSLDGGGWPCGWMPGRVHHTASGWGALAGLCALALLVLVLAGRQSPGTVALGLGALLFTGIEVLSGNAHVDEGASMMRLEIDTTPWPLGPASRSPGRWPQPRPSRAISREGAARRARPSAASPAAPRPALLREVDHQLHLSLPLVDDARRRGHRADASSAGRRPASGP
jgi:hypothetical protein